MAATPALIIKPNRNKSLLRYHPWIFSGALERVMGSPESGQTVEVFSNEGEFLAMAAYSPSSQIRGRVWSFSRQEINDSFFQERIQRAISLRQALGFFQSDLSGEEIGACRLIHSESDGFPGLIVDRYANCLVAQFLSAGVEFFKECIADQLVALSGISNIYERSDADVRQLEGLPVKIGPLRGNPKKEFIFDEHGLKFHVDIMEGQKTGFFLDQQLNRQKIRGISLGRDVLDCFCYSGGFTLNALKGGANSITALDISTDALTMTRNNLRLNSLPVENVTFQQGDVFSELRKYRDARRSFDLIILDPPKFAHSISNVQQAARGYKDINLLAFKLLRPGGILVTFSCSGNISAELFQKIVAGAAVDAGVEAQIVDHLSQAGDHPIALNFPEGAYLKGLVCVKPIN